MRHESNDWRIAVTVILVIFAKGNCDIIVKPIDTEVRVGDSTFLNCSISDISGNVSWYHYPVGDVTKQYRYVYTFGKLNEPYDKRFQMEKHHSSGSFNLVVMNAELQDAGLYVCQDSGKSEQSRSGNSENTSSAQLVVLETDPVCVTNIDGSGFIGENNCGLEKDTIKVSCITIYNGNVPPEMQLERVTGNRTIPIDGSLSLCNAADGRFTCNYTRKSDTELDGSSFVYKTTRSRDRKYSCKTDNITILYAVGNATRLKGTVGDTVKCSIKASSPKPSCNYKWIWADGVDEETMSENQHLTITKDGWNICQVNCSFNHLPCIFKALMVKASTKSVSTKINVDPRWIPVLISMIIAYGIFVSIACIGLILRKKLNVCRSGGEGESLSMPAVCRPDEDDESVSMPAGCRPDDDGESVPMPAGRSPGGEDESLPMPAGCRPGGEDESLLLKAKDPKLETVSRENIA